MIWNQILLFVLFVLLQFVGVWVSWQVAWIVFPRVYGVDASGAPTLPKGRWDLYRSRIGDYMDRFILLTPRGTLRIHRILRADEQRDLHDHPFHFTSVILWGGYTEETPTGSRTYGLGAVNRRQAADLHRIAEVQPNTWTLVVTGPRIREWGFLTEAGWMSHSAYKDRVESGT